MERSVVDFLAGMLEEWYGPNYTLGDAQALVDDLEANGWRVVAREDSE